MLKNQKGITLVSLVITVVVLLILAGVAISIAVSPEGLFTRAQDAKTDWNDDVDEEKGHVENALNYLTTYDPAND